MAQTSTIPSVEEVDATLPPELEHREIVDGRVILVSGASDRHQAAAFELVAETVPWAASTGAVIRFHPFDVYVSRTRVRQPDLLVVRADHLDRVTDRGMVGPPDLVVEILSPSTRRTDLEEKRDEYAAFGVPEYWVVDLEAYLVLVFRPPAAEPRTAGRDETLRPPGLPGLAIDLARVLGS